MALDQLTDRLAKRSLFNGNENLAALQSLIKSSDSTEELQALAIMIEEALNAMAEAHRQKVVDLLEYAQIRQAIDNKIVALNDKTVSFSAIVKDVMEGSTVYTLTQIEDDAKATLKALNTEKADYWSDVLNYINLSGAITGRRGDIIQSMRGKKLKIANPELEFLDVFGSLKEAMPGIFKVVDSITKDREGNRVKEKIGIYVGYSIKGTQIIARFTEQIDPEPRVVLGGTCKFDLTNASVDFKALLSASGLDLSALMDEATKKKDRLETASSGSDLAQVA